MKRLFLTILLLAAALPLAAQLYHPGERLSYRVSYKAKMFPNTEVGTVEVTTAEERTDSTNYYKVTGIGPPTAGFSTSKTSTAYGSIPRRSGPNGSRATSARETTPSRAPTTTTGRRNASAPAGAAASAPSAKRRWR